MVNGARTSAELSQSGSVVAGNLFAPLVGLLRLDRHGGDRARDQAIDSDGFAGHLAPAVLALVDAAQRRIDLGDQLALAVAGPELDAPVGLARGAVVEVGFADRAVLQQLQGVLGG